MQFTSALALAAMAIAPAAAATPGTFGYALGVRNADGSCKQYPDFQADFKALLDPSIKPAPYKLSVVRTYAANDGGANDIGGATCSYTGDLLKAAKENSVKVLLGLWVDPKNETVFKADASEAIRVTKDYKDTVYAYTVGSEGLYREQQKEGTGYKAEYLKDRINDLKTALKDADITGKKVGTADSWNKFQDGTADPLITAGVDLFLVNAFGYWQSQDISNATKTYLDDLYQAFGHIQEKTTAADSLELWNGETGWPTDGGSDYHDPNYSGTAVAGTKNAQTFFTEGVCAALAWGKNVFYFEAFGEQWKPDSVGLSGRQGDEKHWGAFDAQRKPVITDLSCTYYKSEL